MHAATLSPRGSRRALACSEGVLGVLHLPSPLGWIEAHADEIGVTGLSILDHEPERAPRDHPILDSLARELHAYFRGEPLDFSTPTHTRGTPFQEMCWSALKRIPRGSTWTYAHLAREIGKPKATRAVGLANHDNPVAILIPCHRVIASDGTLRGYATGLWRKQRLLELEGARLPSSLFS